MSFITFLGSQMQAVAMRHNANATVFAGRDNLLKGASSELQIQTGNFNAKCASALEFNGREKMKKKIAGAGFDTFA